MKKFLKFFFITILVILTLAVLGVFVFLKTLDLNRYKEQIRESARQALHREVDFRDISFQLSLAQGVDLSLADVSIAEDPDFGTGNFLRAGGIDLGVSLYDLIFKKEIRVLDVELRSLSVTVIKEKDGRLNVQSLAPAPADAASAASVPSDGSSGSLAALPAIMINQFSFKDGRITYIDRSDPQEMRIRIDKINFEATDISLRDEFHFRLQAAYLHESPNINLEGNARIYLSDESFELTNVDVTIALSSLSLEELQQSLPMVASDSVPEELQGTVRLKVTQFRASARGLAYLNARLQLQQGKVVLKELASPLDDIEAQVAMNEKRIDLEQMSFRIKEGTGTMTGTVDSYLSKPSVTLKISLNEIDPADCIDQSNRDIKFKGKVVSESELESTGLDAGAFLENLTGSSSLALKDGRITDLNILKLVLEKVSVIPNLAYLLEGGLPEEWKAKLSRKDTVLTAVNMQARIADKAVTVDSLRMEADTFIFEGTGEAGFDQSFSFDGKFVIPRELAGRMVRAVNEMEYLQNEQGLISFPLSVSGQGSSVSFRPDIKALGISAFQQKGRSELQKVLDKALGRDEQEPAEGEGAVEPQQGTAADAPAQDEASGQQEQKSLEEELIGSVLDTIFK